LPEAEPQPGVRFDPSIDHTDRRVILSVLADSLDDARQRFRASGHPDSDALFIIKTEIYLA
jgi:hypothetical protein